MVQLGVCSPGEFEDRERDAAQLAKETRVAGLEPSSAAAALLSSLTPLDLRLIIKSEEEVGIHMPHY